MVGGDNKLTGTLVVFELTGAGVSSPQSHVDLAYCVECCFSFPMGVVYCVQILAIGFLQMIQK